MESLYIFSDMLLTCSDEGIVKVIPLSAIFSVNKDDVPTLPSLDYEIGEFQLAGRCALILSKDRKSVLVL